MPSRSDVLDVSVEVDPTTSPLPRALRTPEDTPFRILLLGDFTGRANHGARYGVRGCRAIEVDRDNYDTLPLRLGAELELPVAGAGGATMRVSFEELEDFHPDRLYERLPLFQKLRAARKQLSDPAEFRQASAEWRAPPAPAPVPPPQTPPPIEGLGLLDQMMEAAGPPAAPAPAHPTLRNATASDPEWKELIRKIVAPYLVDRPAPRQREMLAELDREIAAQMRALLHHPDFQTLEAAWRAVFFLVSRLETGTGLKLYLADLSQEEFAADLTSGAPRTATIERLLVDDAAGTAGEAPWAFIAADYTFEPSQESAQLLERAGRIARQAGAPFVAGVSSRLVGCSSFGEAPDPDDWNQPATPEDASAWRHLRRLPQAAWLGLAMPRFLLRLPYGRKTSSIDAFEFEEMEGAARHPSLLWGNPAMACACLVGEAFTRSGWDLRPGEISEIDGLPVYVYQEEGAAAMMPCAETWMTEKGAHRIMDQGAMVLASLKNRDAARLVRFQSVADPPTALNGPW